MKPYHGLGAKTILRPVDNVELHEIGVRDNSPRWAVEIFSERNEWLRTVYFDSVSEATKFRRAGKFGLEIDVSPETKTNAPLTFHLTRK